MSGLAKRIFLSGATINRGDEARRYFSDATKLLLEKYPLAEVCSTYVLRAGLPAEAFRTVCRMRINGWATDFVYIENDYSTDALCATEVMEHRSMAELKGIAMHRIRDNLLISMEAP
jgi:hypothetical protein